MGQIKSWARFLRPVILATGYCDWTLGEESFSERLQKVSKIQIRLAQAYLQGIIIPFPAMFPSRNVLLLSVL